VATEIRYVCDVCGRDIEYKDRVNILIYNPMSVPDEDIDLHLACSRPIVRRITESLSNG
jgi:hypothetical protein